MNITDADLHQDLLAAARDPGLAVPSDKDDAEAAQIARVKLIDFIILATLAPQDFRFPYFFLMYRHK